MPPSSDDSRVVTIDCHYIQAGHAAAYALIERDGVAFIDNNTAHAVPLLVEALDAQGRRPDDVAYIVITHLHFDHAGGTSALVKRCPNAQVLCHPLAVKHLVDPARLVASVKRVYGEERFAQLYGVIEPVDPSRIREVGDGERTTLGERTLTFLHTPGHARHQICIYDSLSNGTFTGDMYGIMHTTPLRHPNPCLLFSSAPTDFDADQARDSIRRMRGTGATRVYLAHYGEYTALDKGEAQLLESIAALESILEEACTTALTGDALQAFCERRIREAYEQYFQRWSTAMTSEDWEWLADDMRINAMGLAYLVEKRRQDPA